MARVLSASENGGMVPSSRPIAARFCIGLAFALALASPARAQRLEPGEPEQLFQMTGWVAGVPSAMDLALLPDGRAVIVQQPGDVTIRTADGAVIRNVARFPIKPLTKTEHGLLGVVAHPDFAQNRTLYFYASIGATVADKDQIVKATLSDDNKLTIDYDRPLAKFESPEKHNGSVMIIHKGLLYIGVGDSGGDATPPTNKYASCLNNPKGKILRFGLDGSIPADNPLVDLAQVTGCTTETRTTGGFSMQPPDKRIYAWGMRNPYRFWVDPVTDLLWVADVGEKVREEISVGGSGTHFGYPFEEGSVPYSGLAYDTFGGCKGMVPSTACTRPAHEYANRQGDDSCVIGGFILDHCAWPAAYRNRYLFGDFVSGRIWTMAVTADRRGLEPSSRRQLATFRTLNGFRMGPDGAVYVTAFDASAIYKITPRARPAGCPDGAAGGADAGVGGGGEPGVPAGGAGGASGGGGGQAGGAPRGGQAGGGAERGGQAGQDQRGGSGAGGSGTHGGAGGGAGEVPAGKSSPGSTAGWGCTIARDRPAGPSLPVLGLATVALALALGRGRAGHRRPNKAAPWAVATVVGALMGLVGCGSPEPPAAPSSPARADSGEPSADAGRTPDAAVADAASSCDDPSFVCDPTVPLPASIKATGFFPAAPDLTKTGVGLRAYHPVPELWSDGLRKERYILVPRGRTIDNRDPAAWSFPVGTLFVKTFFDDGAPGKPRPIETRIIRRTADPFAEFEFAVYRWNAAGADAELLSIVGSTRTPVPVTVGGRTFTHQIPSENDCGDCHKAQAKLAGSAVIGFDELRLAGPRPGDTQAQLAQLRSAGLLAEPPSLSPRAIADANPVLSKVKAFVFGNCVHCHHARSSQVDLNPELFVTNTVNQKVDASGIQAPAGWFRVTPGMPEKSVLYVQTQRMIASLPQGMKPMPPVGVAFPDADGLAAIDTWIKSLR